MQYVAVALDPPPTLLTFNGGGNDMLRPGHDTSVQMALIRSVITRCLRAGVRPVLLSGPDPSKGLPFGATIRERGAALTVAGEQLVLTALGVPSTAEPVPTPRPWHSGALAEARYYRDHVAPWVGRRIRKRSSGDLRSYKYADWTEVAAG